MSSPPESKAAHGKAFLFRRVHPLNFCDSLPYSEYSPQYHRITLIYGKYKHVLRERIQSDKYNEPTVRDMKKNVELIKKVFMS